MDAVRVREKSWCEEKEGEREARELGREGRRGRGLLPPAPPAPPDLVKASRRSTSGPRPFQTRVLQGSSTASSAARDARSHAVGLHPGRRRAARRIRGGAASRKSGSRAVRSTIPHDGSSLSNCSQAVPMLRHRASSAGRQQRRRARVRGRKESRESSANEGRLGPLRPPREREKERSSCCAMRRSRGSVAAAQRLEFRS